MGTITVTADGDVLDGGEKVGRWKMRSADCHHPLIMATAGEPKRWHSARDMTSLRAFFADPTEEGAKALNAGEKNRIPRGTSELQCVAKDAAGNAGVSTPVRLMR